MASDPWELEVTGAAEGLARAREVHAQATDARAVAVYRARRAGASLGDLGRLLGMARKNVLELERRGAALEKLSSDEPREVAVPSRIGVASKPLSSDAPRGAAVPSRVGVCVRGGCDAPADRGRFCDRHLYG